MNWLLNYTEIRIYVSENDLEGFASQYHHSLHCRVSKNITKFWDIVKDIRDNICRTHHPQEILKVLVDAETSGICIPETVKAWKKKEEEKKRPY